MPSFSSNSSLSSSTEFADKKRRADNENDANAQFEVGQCYQEGTYTSDAKASSRPNLAKAEKYLKLAAKQGHVDAQCCLALLYHQGGKGIFGIKKDIPSAIFWYEKAARQNNPNAMASLAVIYQTDMKDAVKAQEWRQKAAEFEQGPKQYQLGLQYLNQRKFEKALEWIEKAAKQGHAQAQWKMGQFHQEGFQSLVKDANLAKVYYLRAAEQNLVKAHFSLARCYEKQFHDKVFALRHYREARQLAEDENDIATASDNVDRLESEQRRQNEVTSLFSLAWVMALFQIILAAIQARFARNLSGLSVNIPSSSRTVESNLTEDSPSTLSDSAQPGNDIFIIHTGQQKGTEVATLKRSFEERGYSCFFDHDIPKSKPPKTVMQDELVSCRHAIAIISKSFLTKPCPCAELKFAFDKMMWLRERQQWHSLWVILLDVSVEEYKEAVRATNQRLPAIFDEVQLYEYYTGRYGYWTKMCDKIVEDVMGADKEEGARYQWINFHVLGGSILEGFPDPTGMYDATREDAGCVSPGFFGPSVRRKRGILRRFSISI